MTSDFLNLCNEWNLAVQVQKKLKNIFNLLKSTFIKIIKRK